MKTRMTETNMTVGAHRDLLDIIDSLRSQGVSHYVDLPEIIVCGDQNAGKSSVLEAISSLKFPTQDGLCTRFATELVLRRSPEVKTRVSITPGEHRYGDDKERLESWQPKSSIETGGLDMVTEEAKEAMANEQGTGEFYEDILRIELTGPTQPHLTMVDLPGFFRSGDKNQSDADVEIVRNMVKKYMARQRGIILTVVSAKYDYVLQEVTAMAKEADPGGLRTMGLITKPDTLDAGSDTEKYFVSLAQNLETHLRLGWHVLKNRSFDEHKRGVTLAERDTIEADFFRNAPWNAIDSSHCGVAALRVRLSVVLRDQILVHLPSLVRDVEKGIRDCIGKLDRLGPVRENPQQQMSYLLRVSEEYTSLMTQAVEGTYTDRFFGNGKKLDRFKTRLRAVVQDRLHKFAEEMRRNGQSQYIVDSDSEDEGGRELRDVARISRADYVQDVAERLKYSKGRELQGMFNPLIVSDLFLEQCDPWKNLARLLVDEILDAVDQTTKAIVEHVTASDVTQGVLQRVRQEIERLKGALDAQVDALLASTMQHPITYNPELIKNVQRIQLERYKRDAKKLISTTFGAKFDDPDTKMYINPIQLLDLVGGGFERVMERFGSAMAVDYMEAYYQVALSRFIDDMSTLAIEDCLISKLPTIFRSSDIPGMSAEDISRLAGETPESSDKRTRLESKRAALETGLQNLRRVYRHSDVDSVTTQDSVESKEPGRISPSTSSISEIVPLVAGRSDSSSPVAEKYEVLEVGEVAERAPSPDTESWGQLKQRRRRFTLGPVENEIV